MTTGLPSSAPLAPKGALAIIPARGGSKRIPRKNVRDFCGRPMIAWSIEAALQSGCFSEVVVSTDDAEIAAVARESGASVPFMRAEELSDDRTGVAPVVLDVIEKTGADFETACCILPTAPFTDAALLARASRLFRESPDCSMVFGAVRFGHPVQRGFRLIAGRAKMLFPEYLLARSQDLEPTFHDAGQFYFFSVPSFRAKRTFSFDGALFVEMAETEVQDIDTEGDWRLAEIKWLFLREKSRADG